MKNRRLIVLGLTLFSLPYHAIALDGSINLGVGVEHTDNALKSNTNQRSELEKKADASVQLKHESDSVVVEVNYSAVFTSYDKGTQGDETTVTGEASIVYEQIKEQLFWTIENSRSNIIRDKQLVDVESNREDRSISTISPMLIVRPSSVDTINTNISYTDIAYEDSDQQNSERMGANINWLHALSKVDNVSVGLSYQDVTFDIDDNDYEYYRGTLSYEAALSKLQYSIVVGYNQSKREVDDVSGGYFSAAAGYNHGASVWALSVVQELTDTSQQNNDSDLTGLGDSNNLSVVVDVFERSSIELTYDNENLCDSCSFNVSALYEKEAYETLDNNGDELALNINFGYRFSRLTTLGMDVSYNDFSFDSDNARDDYDVVDYGLNLRQSIIRNFSLLFQITYSERSSNQNSGDYEELRGGVSFSYRFD